MKTLICLLLFELGTSMVYAATYTLGSPPIPPPGALVSQTSASISVTTSTANVLLPNSVTLYPFVNILNDGATEAFFAFGTTSGAAATLTNIPITSSHCISVYSGLNTYVAAISTGTTTLHITQSNGPACPQ